MRVHSLIVFVGPLFLCTTAHAGDGIRQGKWQYTSTMQMEGMPQQMPKLPPGVQLPPGMKMPTMGPGGMTTSFENCITSDDPVPHNQQHERNCKITHMDRTGNHFTWGATCELPGGGTSQSEGDGTYSDDSSQVTIKTTSVEDGHPKNMTMNVTGHYVGPCQ